MSKLEVLCATMHQENFCKIEDMRIQSDVIFANQSNTTSFNEAHFGDYHAKMITTQTRGVGANRNIALIYATGEYLLLSDDDLHYVDDYRSIVERAFMELPQADCIIFNIETIGAVTGRRKNKGVKRVRWYNALNYGAARIAVKRVSVSRENIMFNQNFGGGTPFSCGEDTLFVVEMLKKKLKLYTYPETIATVDQYTSTWFRGYDRKFYYDKGILFASISRFWAKPLCLQSLIRHPNYRESGLTFREAYRLMCRGIKNQRDLISWNELSTLKSRSC